MARRTDSKRSGRARSRARWPSGAAIDRARELTRVGREAGRRAVRAAAPLSRQPAVRTLGWIALALVVASVLPDTSSPAPRPRPDAAPLALFETEPEVRVLLARIDGGRSFDLDAQPLIVRRPDGTIELPKASRRIRWTAEGARIDSRNLPSGSRIEAAVGAELRWQGRTYPGHLEIGRKKGQVGVICVVPLELYLEGVVASEMGPTQKPAAMEAQAICARSYACRRIRHRPGAGWHVDSSQRTQVWKGHPRPRERARRAVQATRGLVLTFESDILDALYSSTCGDTTRASGEAFGGTTIPPLSGVSCGACREAPLHRWRAEVSLARLAEVAGRGGLRPVGLRLTHTTSGRLDRLHLRFAGGEQRSLDGRALRRAVGSRLRSRWVTRATVRGGKVELEGQGFGHGVGLCQYGARGMAAGGRSSSSILAHYYPGTRLRSAW